MKKINRRTFLQQAGLVTAALAAGMYDQVAARPSSGTAAEAYPQRQPTTSLPKTAGSPPRFGITAGR